MSLKCKISKKSKGRKSKTDNYDKYRQILGRPDLTDRQIDQMRKHLGLLALTICEYVWKKKFY